MKKYALIFLLVLLFGACKKNPPKAAVIKPKCEKKFVHMYGIAIDSLLLKKYNDSLLYSFYRQNGFRTVWSKAETRKSAAAAIEKAGEDGLDPNEYNADKLSKREKKIHSMSEKEMIEYDILLTASVRKYMSHLAKGKLNPKKLYWNWDLRPDDSEVNTLLSEAIVKDSLSAAISRVMPKHVMYLKLKKALQLIEQFPKDRCPTIDTKDQKISAKDTNNALLAIKKRL